MTEQTQKLLNFEQIKKLSKSLLNSTSKVKAVMDLTRLTLYIYHFFI